MEPDPSMLPDGYDRLVDESADIDRLCSSSDWVLPAAATWLADGLVTAAEPGAAVVLGRSRLRRGADIWCGLDPVWGFSCPVVGGDPLAAADLAARCLGSDRRWELALLSGLVPGSARERALARALAGRYPLFEGPSMTRRLADLDGGVDAWLDRRSAPFRRNQRRAERAQEAAGIEIELLSGGGVEVIDRCAALEARSWKGQQGAGLCDDGFADFYRRLAQGVEPSGRLRAGFARHGGRDIGYILGIVRNCTYRGLQISYDQRYRDLSLGNQLQVTQMRALAADGVHLYDLGMDMPYKQHWADGELTTRTLVVRRR